MTDESQSQYQSKLDKELHLAVLNAQIRDSALLLKEGAYIDSRNRDNQAPAHALLASDTVKAQDKVMMLKFLADNGADMNLSDKNGTPLYYAALMADYASTKFMDSLAQGDAKKEYQVREDHMLYLNMVEFLLERGADFNIKADSKSLSPLEIIKNSSDKELKYILNKHLNNTTETIMKNEFKKSQSAQSNEEKDDMAKFVVTLTKEKAEDVMKEINTMIGHDEFKKEAERFFYRAQFNKACKEHGVPSIQKGYHLALTGNPGTGKTMEARLRARLLYALDIAGPQYAEVSRAKLVDKIIGGTEDKFLRLITQADQIFIDEAPSLSNDDSKRDFGHRIIEALIPVLENERTDKVVMFAGYTEDMDRFLSSDAGLNSRTKKRHIPDPTEGQLKEILQLHVGRAGRSMSDDVTDYAMEKVMTIKTILGEREFGNGRVVRDLVEDLPDIMAERLFSTQAPTSVKKEDLTTVLRLDIDTLDPVATMAGSRLAAKKEVSKKMLGFKPMAVA